MLCTVQGCTVVQGWQSFMIKNQYGRTQLKPQYMKLKGSFDKSGASIIDTNAIYYYHTEDKLFDMEFNFIIRFFDTGQYAFFASTNKPIINLSFEDIDYLDLEKATNVGYYKIKDSTVILEKPNHLFRRAGKRNLDKYKVLFNGNLNSVTNAASDYQAVYTKIKLNQLLNDKIKPDW